MLQNADSYKSEALDIANVAKSICEAIFKHDNFNFCGDFTLNCQKDCLPYNLKLLISMILYGPSLKSEETRFPRMFHCRTTYSIQHQKSTRKRLTKA